MTAKPSLVAISGSVRAPSRTTALVRSIQSALESRLDTTGLFVSLTEVAPLVMGALTRDQLSPAGRDLIRTIESADILIVGSPIYRASFTGALKHLFDLLHYQALSGAVAMIAATGGTPLHGLATEHQFRPLLSYFGIVSVPTTIYALETDFVGTELINASIAERIERAADEAAKLVGAGLRLTAHSPVNT
jgi:FMN reductase